MPTFTYTFAGNLGSISVVTQDNPQPVSPDGGGTTYLGYPITAVSGTFNGQQVTGLFGASGRFEFSGGADAHNNTIFANAAQGYAGSSYDGIDAVGIDFGLADGNHINLAQASRGASQLRYQVYNPSQVQTGTFGNTTVTATNYDALVCFASGTRIRVLRAGAEADVPVEALAVGDLAVTASGARRPIRWIGSRGLDPRRHARPQEARPVRIRAHALGPDRPARDLVVSPGHAIAVDVLGEVLIPASALIDGRTVTQEDVAHVTYWHVELDGHDLLLAEGLAAESYLDMGNRGFFAGAGVTALHAGPDAAPSPRTHADFCRPFHAAGPLVDLVRAQVAARADAAREDAPADRGRPAAGRRIAA